MLIIIFIVLFVLIIIALRVARKKPITIQGHWRTFLDGFQLPANEFYQAVKAGLAERNITQVSLTEESFLEKHIFFC